MPITVLAIKNVVRQRRRSIVALLAVACGIAALILASGFIEWNLWFGRESTIHSQLGHVRIFKAGYLESGHADPFGNVLKDDPDRLRLIKGEPGVAAVAPRLSFSGLISHGDATLSFIGEGVDPDAEAQLSRSLSIVQGEGLSMGAPDGIILGQGLAANLGAGIGDTVVLVANTATGGVNAVEVKVRGLFATITKAYDDSALRVPIPMARRLIRVSGAHSYAILLDRTESTDAVIDRLRRELSGQSLEIVPWYQLADFYNKTAELFSRQVDVLRLIIALIIVLSISNSMMRSVLERTGDIGTALALGTRRGRILLQFLIEGATLGVLGGIIGLVGGYVIARLVSAVGIPMPPPPGMAFGYVAQIAVTPPIALQAAALAVATTIAASIYPAWMASRMNIVDALRHNR